MSDTNLNNKSACKFESKIKAENKRIIPKGALLYISFRNVLVRSSANEKSKILNKGFTLALHCSYPIFLLKLNISICPVVSFEATGFLYPKTEKEIL